MSGRRRRGVSLAGCTNNGAHRPVIVRINDHYVRSGGVVIFPDSIENLDGLNEELGPAIVVLEDSGRAIGSLFAWQCPECGRPYRLRTQTLDILLKVRIAKGKRANWLDLSRTEAAVDFWRQRAEWDMDRVTELHPYVFHWPATSS